MVNDAFCLEIYDKTEINVCTLLKHIYVYACTCTYVRVCLQKLDDNHGHIS